MITISKLTKLIASQMPIWTSAALVAALVLPQAAEAHGQVFARSATLGSSEISSLTSVTFRWTTGTGGTVRGIRLQTCTSPTYNSACVKPSGAGFNSSALNSVSGGLTGGWSYSTSAGEATLTKPGGDNLTSGVAAIVNVNNFVNPAIIGTFYYRVTTYNNTSLSVGSEIDFGAVAVSTAAKISGSAAIAGTLIFRIANAVDDDCGGQTDVVDPTDAASDFVTLSPNPGSVVAPSVGTAQFCVAENAQNGFAVTYRDAALGGVEKGFYNGAHEFDNGGAGGTVSKFASLPGSEQFGFNLRANTTPALGANPDQAGVLSDLPNADYSTPNRFSYDDSGNAVVLASRGNPTNSARYTLSYVANIAASTPGGTYMAHQIFTCTATF